MSVTATVPETSVDAFLGGMVEAVQPKRGHHRSGLEAVLLAAAIEVDFTGTAVDLGAGVGVAGFGIAARCPGARVVLVERDAEAIACAGAALARPANRDFADRVSVVSADIGDWDSGSAKADTVVMNPPFHGNGAGTRSPRAARAAAHVLGDDGLSPWVDAAAGALAPGGRLVVVFRADQLEALLAALGRQFSDSVILPIRPRERLPAHRVLVRAVRGRGQSSRTLPPLTLHGPAGGAYLPNVDRMLRGEIGLADAHAGWGE
jgi:tRNA1(Val) A37 N6-methylase TrmN6